MKFIEKFILTFCVTGTIFLLIKDIILKEWYWVFVWSLFIILISFIIELIIDGEN